MTAPRPLSAAAQAVLDAVVDGALPPFHVIARPMAAAAIRALVEQVAVIAPAGDRAWSEGQAASYAAITTAVRRMQSIAAELHGGPAHHPRRPPMSTLETNPTPTAPDWRALCQGLLQAIDDDVIDANDGPRFQAVVDRTRAALATPPAATREAEHDDGDDVIDRWVDSKSDWISNWGAPRSSIAALIGEALEHWGRSATREAGPLPQAPTAAAMVAAYFDRYDRTGPLEDPEPVCLAAALRAMPPGADLAAVIDALEAMR
jgi:hypothetical protein